MFQSPLTMIGVIATVLAMVFAVAAWLNSRKRQILLQQLEAQDEEASPSAASAPFEEPSDRPASVFKMVGPDGQPSSPLVNAPDIYTWE